MATICETAIVSVTSGDAGTVEFVVPAYTQSPDALKPIVEELVKAYFAASHIVGAPTSLADFAMFALTRASRDPLEVE